MSRKRSFNNTIANAKHFVLVLNICFYCSLQKTRYSKLEKADILEMTVRFLSDIPPVNNKSEFSFKTNNPQNI